jgi:AcrR family transcriptional regulator
MNVHEKKQKTRQDILDAAREVFYREDYVGTNVDEIAATARISKGAVYRYFANKAALYVSVLGQDSKNFFSDAERGITATEELHTADRIRNLWSNYCKHWIRNPDAFRIFWAFDNEAVIGELPKELTEKIAENWKRSLELTKRVLDEGIRRGELIPIDTWAGAQAYWTLATSLIEQDNVRGRRKIRDRDFLEVYDVSIELLLRGMLVDPSQSKLSASAPVPENNATATEK